jgi:hypothetical protein
MKELAKLPQELVPVDKIAEAFRVSERAVQRLVIYEGMPRKSRGEYDYYECLKWYAAHLHHRVCGCTGPCEGLDAESRNIVNVRAERRKALKEIVEEIAQDLVGLNAEAIQEILTKAIDDCYAK